MSLDTFRIGFLPLVDAALPILARELGLAEEQGIDLELVRDMSWATVRDRLIYGGTDAAHLVAPLAIATTLGLDRPPVPMSVPFVLGLNGNAVTLAPPLAEAICTPGELLDSVTLGQRLAALISLRAREGTKLRFGVVHRYSSHNYMLQYWLRGSGVDIEHDVEIVTIAPPFAADALAMREIDGICVGEPWNSVAVERGVGVIVNVTSHIWLRGVEKVLAMLTARAEGEPEMVHRLIRALYSAGEAFIDPERHATNAAILARADYLDGSADMIERAISDRIKLAQGHEPMHIPDFMFQHREAANFPWASQAAWLYAQMVRAGHLVKSDDGYAAAQRVFRPDIYRAALAGTGVPLPGASAKLEGGISETTGVGTVQGRLLLGSDRFFDGRAFDPEELDAYLAQS
ncbi:MAG: ABC transporter substrate-binding protein [Sphingobium sp.]|nr:ABC transporter substrate-binding protein [Sphingobium sp.]MCI1272491.1 ABC transporter substrate-binding protein [Sphingobium sp.]MCI1757378.1 ABC transporter substrate-binding protein [Sphingobium sp.]MCI2054271.1 ABC transporter substrate-binding protein [Sphingobium sp.]